MSERWVSILLAILFIIALGLSGALYIEVVSLRGRLHACEVEKGRLREEISELKRSRLENMTVMIGVTAASDYDYNRTKRLFEEIIEKEVNEYCDKLGRNIAFKFIVKNNKGSPSIALQNLQDFKEMGIDIIIGHPSSAACCVSMPYVERYNMLLFSPRSETGQLARPGDNLLRLYPSEMLQGRVIAKIIENLEIEAVVVIQADTKKLDYIYDVFEGTYSGIILKRIKYDLCELHPKCEEYNPEIAEDYLKLADEAVERFCGGDVGILILGFDETVELIKRAKRYPALYRLLWFGTDTTAKNPTLLNEAPEEAAHLKILSPLPTTTKSPLYKSLNESYYTLFSEPLNLYDACKYDIAWILIKSILQIQSTDIEGLIKVIPIIAAQYLGASGWCKLDENGDRYIADYEIWGYGYVDGNVGIIKYGFYNGINEEINWNRKVEN